MENLSLIKKSNTYKIIIPANVEEQIRYLCQRIPTKEWSGVLFYTYEGSMETEDLVVTCKDIYVMDIGSAAYTEFYMSPEVISYMTENPDLLDCQMGLIHSHNNMATFFSGTDTATLLKEGEDRNHFVSLIVNNAGTYTAGITRLITRTRDVHDCYKYKSFDDEEIENCEDYVEEYTSVEWFNLEVEKHSIVMPFSSIESRLAEINKRKEAPKTAYKVPTITNPSYTLPQQKNNLFDFDFSEVESSPVREFKYNIPKTIEEKAKNILPQLVTGSVTSTQNKMSLPQWVTGPMVTMFDNRFKDLKSYEDWAEIMVEYVLFEDVPEEYSRAEDVYIAELSNAISEMLGKLPQNKYTKVLNKLLTAWI